MKILLGSKNSSKEKSLVLALNELNISEYEIITYDVSSSVNSKPIGYEIIRGADNRNNELRKIAIKDNISYDYLCSIEGGFSADENGLPFIVTYCIIEDRNQKKSTGKSLGLRLSKEMFKYVQNGKSLNKIIEQIKGIESNKKNGGITGYLTRGLLSRDVVDKDAVLSALIPFIYKTERDTINKIIEETKI